MDEAAASPARVLAIFGPTATGKSALAHALARQLDGEIVVCDPFQRYRGLRIAADGPRDDERAAVAYHLVDDLTLDRGSSAADFAHRAHGCIDDILDRGRVPIVAGGTGLYILAATRQIDFPPPPDPQVRAWAEDLVANDPDGARRALHARDPTAADTVDTANPRRLARALERAAGGATTGTALFTAPYRHPTLLIALTRPRPVIDALIAQRVQREMDEGLRAELEAALDYPGVAREPLQVIGAAEVAAIRDGTLSEEQLPDRLATRTRRLARRQLQWLRRMPDARVIDLADEPATHAMGEVVQAWRDAGGDDRG